MSHPDEVQAVLDPVMAEAWPAPETIRVGGWLVRAADGVTRRANSALVDTSPGGRAELEAAVDEVEAFYQRRDLPTLFQVSEATTAPAVVDALAGRGYGPTAATWMLWGRLDQLAADPDRGSGRRDWPVSTTAEPADGWFATYWATEGARHEPSAAALLRQHLLRPQAPTAFVAVGDPEEPRSVAQVVIVGPWACAQCLVTAPDGRRQGAARAATGALIEAARAHGAVRLFVAVLADNEPSLAWCRQLGLRPSHRYWYYLR